MATNTDLRPWQPWALAGAVLGIAMLSLYLGLVLSEGDNSIGVVAPWAALMGCGCLAALAAVLIRSEQLARKLMIGGALIWGVLGLVSILSIGIGFLTAAALLVIAADRARPNR